MLLYLIRFEKMFKIGITQDDNRIYKLETIYQKFNPRLHESYILHYYRRSTVKNIENLIKDSFVDFRYDFEGKTFDGFTECFRDDCFEEVLSILESHVRTNNKNKKNINEYMKLVKGIKKELLEIPDKKKKAMIRKENYSKISGGSQFFCFLQENEENVWVELRKKNKKFYMTIHFQKHIPENMPPWVNYSYEDESIRLSTYIIRLDQYKRDFHFGLAYFTFEINFNPLDSFCQVEFPELVSFYKELFSVLNVDDKWIKIRNEYFQELEIIYYQDVRP